MKLGILLCLKLLSFPRHFSYVAGCILDVLCTLRLQGSLIQKNWIFIICLILCWSCFGMCCTRLLMCCGIWHKHVTADLLSVVYCQVGTPMIALVLHIPQMFDWTEIWGIFRSHNTWRMRLCSTKLSWIVLVLVTLFIMQLVPLNGAHGLQCCKGS